MLHVEMSEILYDALVHGGMLESIINLWGHMIINIGV